MKPVSLFLEDKPGALSQPVRILAKADYRNLIGRTKLLGQLEAS